MAKFICYGCSIPESPKSPPCILDAPGLDIVDLRCVVRDDDDRIKAEWRELDPETDDDE
jgi:hypothetical protein